LFAKYGSRFVNPISSFSNLSFYNVKMLAGNLTWKVTEASRRFFNWGLSFSGMVVKLSEFHNRFPKCDGGVCPSWHTSKSNTVSTYTYDKILIRPVIPCSNSGKCWGPNRNVCFKKCNNVMFHFNKDSLSPRRKSTCCWLFFLITQVSTFVKIVGASSVHKDKILLCESCIAVEKSTARSSESLE
jgi:hypothetical protein